MTRPLAATTVKNRDFDRMLRKRIETFLDDSSDHDHYMNDLAVACQTDEQWEIVCDTLHMVGDDEFIIGELPADYIIPHPDDDPARPAVIIQPKARDVICIRGCWLIVTSQQQKTYFEISTGEPHELPVLPPFSGRRVYHLTPGDRVVFTEVASSDTPYDKLLALYPRYFAETGRGEVIISGVDN